MSVKPIIYDLIAYSLKGDLADLDKNPHVLLAQLGLSISNILQDNPRPSNDLVLENIVERCHKAYEATQLAIKEAPGYYGDVAKMDDEIIQYINAIHQSSSTELPKVRQAMLDAIHSATGLTEI